MLSLSDASCGAGPTGPAPHEVNALSALMSAVFPIASSVARLPRDALPGAGLGVRTAGDVDPAREMHLSYPEETPEQGSGNRCDEMRDPRAPHWQKQQAGRELKRSGEQSVLRLAG
jgi:hypothetical protein